MRSAAPPWKTLVTGAVRNGTRRRSIVRASSVGLAHNAYLEDNLGALDVTLSGNDLARIDEIMPPGAAACTRYRKAGMASVNR